MVKAGLMLVTVVAIVAGAAAAPHAAAQQGFQNRSKLVSALPRSLVFDLGAVDYDGDSDLDLFTTNHNDRGGLLANDGAGFVDQLTTAGLDQSRGFPGFEDRRQPVMQEHGTYLFWSGGSDAAEGAMVVEVREDPGVEVSGTLEFAFPVQVRQADGAQVSTRTVPGTAPPRTVASFTAAGRARIVLEPDQMAAPFEVEIAGPYPLSRVFVGPRLVSPPSRRFTLQLRDRHGIAWGDYDRDGTTDAFIVRGGLKGDIGEFPDGLITDELMLGGGPELVDRIDGSGLAKGACRGRETIPVDIDADGRLDLFWGCQGAPPALFRQQPDGKFSDASAGLRNAGVHGDHYAWVDIAGDGRPELIALRRERLVVYERSELDRWARLESVRTFGESPGRIAYSDFDGDGDPDLFCAAPHGNTLLVNHHGRLKAKRPRRFGLPSRSVAASWVDFDDDGRTDLYAAPQGLFRRRAGRRFHATGAAALPRSTQDALATWFDYDGDGARDLAVAIGKDGWRFKLLRNRHTSKHWLQVELTGPGGEYPAAGASATVVAGGRRQTRWVGESDGSRYSQGHYRLYFGLGRADRVRKLRVRWPSGASRKLRGLSADRLVRVSFDPS